jgi:hypothetical protein
VRIWRLRLNEGELLLVIGCTDFTRHIPPKEYWKTKCPVIGVGHAVAAVDWPKDFTATASSSLTSKTVCSFVLPPSQVGVRNDPATSFPFKEACLASRDTRRRVGVLGLRWT